MKHKSEIGGWLLVMAYAFFLIALFAALSLLPSKAKGADFKLTSLDHLSLDVSRFSCNRELMTPEIPCDQYFGRVQLNWDVGLLGDLIKWRNEVHSEGTRSKFMTVGWKYTLAIPIPGGLELFMQHHSRHTMDQDQPGGVPYPVEDSAGIRFIWFERGTK